MVNSRGNFREFWEVMRAYPSAQGGFIWDWAEQNFRRPLINTPGSSGHDIAASLSGKPRVVDGYGGKGKALYLSGLDDFVEIYRDPKLDLTGTAVTLDARVGARQDRVERAHRLHRLRPRRRPEQRHHGGRLDRPDRQGHHRPGPGL